MKLTDTVIKAKTKGLHALAQNTGKPQKLTDGGGLYLLFTVAGGRSWNWKYRIAGKEKRATFGQYPEISLAQARERHQAARRLLAEGIDPGEKKKADRRAAKLATSNSFEAVAREWLAHRGETVQAAQNVKTLARMEGDVFPWLGSRTITQIDAPEILEVLKRVDGRGARFTAHRLRSEISRVFRHGIKLGVCKVDPAKDLMGAIPSANSKHFAAITEPTKVAEMLRAFDAFSGTLAVHCALRLAPLLFVRPGELRTAEWAQFDLDQGEWRYTVTKTNTEHLVPLAAQAVAILRELHPLTGHGRYVFPGARDSRRPMSGAAVNAALRRLGYDTRTEITGHGFRAMARTILHEELGQKPEVIEHQLAHAVPDVLGSAYNRTKFIKERRAMMALWANYLDGLKAGNVVPLSKSA